jgi:serine protease Do
MVMIEKVSNGDQIRRMTGFRKRFSQVRGTPFQETVPIVLLVVLGCALGGWAWASESVRRDATVRAVDKTMPSVVNIRTEILVERQDFYYDLLWDFFGPYYRRRPAESTYSLGSGVIIHDSGYVLTNAHVVNRASRVEVILQDGSRYEAEPIAGMRSSDVALLKIKGEDALPTFQAVSFAREDDLMLGETVLALGNPFGLGSSVSRGILSSKNRRPPMENEPLEIEDWLQTDAAINPGNSGGPLVNLDGEMIGLNVAVFKEGQGIGFAIPIKRINEAISEIMTPEILDGLWFGAKLDAGARPMKIKEVQQGSPADKAGFKVDDAILSVDGQPVAHAIDFHHMLTRNRGKDAVIIAIDRDRENKKISLQLIPEESFFNAQLVREKTGVLLQEMSPQLARNLNLDSVEGALVADVDEDGPGAKAGIRNGFVVLRINDLRVDSMVGLAKYLYELKSDASVRVELLVQRKVGRFLTLNRAGATLVLR